MWHPDRASGVCSQTSGVIALGSSNMAHIREAFRMAIYKLAVQVIMVHNHPGGNVMPYSFVDLTREDSRDS